MKIKIPFKTPTINHIYFNWNNRRILTKEAKDLKKKIAEIIHSDTCGIYDLEGNKLKVNVEVHEDWMCKNGTVKRVDISNREKFLIDAVFDALGIDDKYIFEHTMKKVQDTKEFAIIKINAK